METSPLRLRSPAKINLFLDVLERMANGYHRIDTVMTFVDWFDEMAFSLTEGPSIEIEARGPWAGQLPVPEENLIWRGLAKLQALVRPTRGIRVSLYKRIPIQAGLGGASGNLAAALIAGNHLWQLGQSRDQLEQLASELGSDAPFFVRGQTARCTGRGEWIEPIVGCTGLHLVLARPPRGLATADVYRQATIAAEPRSPDQLITGLRQSELSKIAPGVYNRLQLAAGNLTHWISRLRQAFAQTSASAHQLTGSGSCYFGIYRTHLAARRAAKRISAVWPECLVAVKRTLSQHRHRLP